jgi:hypothetical protein
MMSWLQGQVNSPLRHTVLNWYVQCVVPQRIPDAQKKLFHTHVGFYLSPLNYRWETNQCIKTRRPGALNETVLVAASATKYFATERRCNRSSRLFSPSCVLFFQLLSSSTNSLQWNWNHKSLPIDPVTNCVSRVIRVPRFRNNLFLWVFQSKIMKGFCILYFLCYISCPYNLPFLNRLNSIEGKFE